MVGPLVDAVVQRERVRRAPVLRQVADALQRQHPRLVGLEPAGQFWEELEERVAAPSGCAPGGRELVDGRVEVGPAEVARLQDASGRRFADAEAQVLVQHPAAFAIERGHVSAVGKRESRAGVRRALGDDEPETLLQLGIQGRLPALLERREPLLPGVPSAAAVQGIEPSAGGVAGELPDENVRVVVHLACFVPSMNGGDRLVLLAEKGGVERRLDGGVHRLPSPEGVTLGDEAQLLRHRERVAEIPGAAPAVVVRLTRAVRSRARGRPGRCNCEGCRDRRVGCARPPGRSSTPGPGARCMPVPRASRSGLARRRGRP